MEHLHWALVSKKIRQTERECVQHILICPFGWLGKNIMPLLGSDGGMERQGKRTSRSAEIWRKRKGLREVGIERGKDDGSEGRSEKGMKSVFS